jgi:hypothetical protein
LHEEDIRFIDEEDGVPSFCQIEPLEELGLDFCFSGANIGNCQRK